VTAGASLVGRCVVCGRDLPPGSRSQRRTCSDACRVALLRSQRAPSSVRADVDAAVTVSVGLRASDAADTSPPSQEPLGL
jgi:hypothetical protein